MVWDSTHEQVKPSRPLPPPPKDGSTDHERAADLARKAREKGMNFYYFPQGFEQMASDARELDSAIDASPGLRQYYEDTAPIKGVNDFFESLECLQHEKREEQVLV